MLPGSLTGKCAGVTMPGMSADPASEKESLQAAKLRCLAGILERIARGDTSVTDEVFWLQAHEDVVAGPRDEPLK
jgi:hypothetical protein